MPAPEPEALTGSEVVELMAVTSALAMELAVLDELYDTEMMLPSTVTETLPESYPAEVAGAPPVNMLPDGYPLNDAVKKTYGLYVVTDEEESA
jgi:hypothetical protein